MKKNKPPKKLIQENGKFNAPVLTHMRDTVYSPKAIYSNEIFLERNERMRNDQALLDAAAAKRARKLERNKKCL